MEHAQQTIIDFLSGNLDIIEFRYLYETKPEINAFLQNIIDELKNDSDREPIPYTCVLGDKEYSFCSVVPYLLDPHSYKGNKEEFESTRRLLTYEYMMVTHDVETASGANRFYNDVYEIYYQIDQGIPYCYKYEEAFNFAIEVIPEYLEGGESEKYIQKYIIPLFPETMKKTERKKAIKSKIKEVFKSVKGYPSWPQYSEWPMDKEGKPCTYIGKGKSEGDLRRFRFKDETTGEEIIVEQEY